MITKRCSRFALLVWLCLLAQAATAEASFRSLMRDKGVEFRVGYISQTATNVQGGNRQLWRYADEWAFGATADLEKFFGVPQAQLRVTLTDRNGRSLSNDAQLGSLQAVQGIYGRGQTWHWTQFAYHQQFREGFLDWKIGRLVGGEDFADFPCEFMNLALCGPPPGNIATNYWYNWPVSQWGTRLRASFKGFGYVQVGVFDANQNYLLTGRGLDLGTPGGTSGVLVPVEVAWQPRFGGRLEGTYKFGAWYNSSRADRFASNAGNHGEYIQFIQRLTAPSLEHSQRGIRVFLNATLVERQSAPLDSQIAAGLFYTGPLALRPDDQLGVAVGRTHANARVASAADSRAEYVSEVFYRVQATRWLDLRPTVQYVHQSGGAGAHRGDVVLGLRLTGNL